PAGGARRRVLVVVPGGGVIGTGDDSRRARPVAGAGAAVAGHRCCRGLAVRRLQPAVRAGQPGAGAVVFLRHYPLVPGRALAACVVAGAGRVRLVAGLSLAGAGVVVEPAATAAADDTGSGAAVAGCLCAAVVAGVATATLAGAAV